MDDISDIEKLYGNVIAVQGDVYWTAKLIVIKNKTTFIAIQRTPPDDSILHNRIIDHPDQQRLF